MKTMTFQAHELTEALAKVRQQLGPDALILSTKEVSPLFGIGRSMLEVVAARPDVEPADENAPRSARPASAPRGAAAYAAAAGANRSPSIAATGVGRGAMAQMSRLVNRTSGRTSVRDQEVSGAASALRQAGQGRGADPVSRDTLRSGPNELGEGFFAGSRSGRGPQQTGAVDGAGLSSEAAIDARLLPLQREVRALKSQIYQVTQNSAALAAPALKQEVEELRAVIRTMSASAQKHGEVTSEAARLINIGIERPRAEALLERAREIGGEPDVALRKAISERIATAGPVGVSARVAAFIGPTGVGKTTTIAKIAARAALIDGARVALITIDTFRVGAIDQLQRYADLMELPLLVAGTSAALKAAVRSNEGADLILVDTAGRGPRDAAQLAALRELLGSADGVETHLCLAATTRSREQALAVQSYRPLNPTRLCFTKLDETFGLGEILNLHESSRLPLSYFGTGQKVPEDLELCSAEGFAARLLAGPKGAQPQPPARPEEMGGRT